MWDDKQFTENIRSQDIAPYLLVALFYLGGSSHRREVHERLEAIMDVADEVLAKKHKGSETPQLLYVAGWSATTSRKLGYLKQRDEVKVRGQWELTNAGIKKADELIVNADDPKIATKFREEHTLSIKNLNKELREKRKNANESEEADEEMPDENEELDSEDPIQKQRIEDLEYIINNIEPYEFELLCNKLLTKMGAEMTPTKQSSDHGIDGIGQYRIGMLTFKFIIQVKRWKREKKISEKEIQSLVGAKEKEQAEKAIFITTSSFQKNAIECAQQVSVRLIDGEELIDLLEENEVGYSRKLTLSKDKE